MNLLSYADLEEELDRCYKATKLCPCRYRFAWPAQNAACPMTTWSLAKGGKGVLETIARFGEDFVLGFTLAWDYGFAPCSRMSTELRLGYLHGAAYAKHMERGII